MYNLVNRAIKLSGDNFHDSNIKFCKNLLLLNDYPNKFINKFIGKRLHTIKQINSNTSNNINSNITDQNRNNYISSINTNIYNRLPKAKLPFVPVLFNNLKNIYIKNNIIPMPMITNKLSQFIIKGKDSIPKMENVNSVYNFKCNICQASYTGESKRALYHRIEEHQKDIDNNRDKVVPKHCINGHGFNLNKVSILDRKPNLYKRRISENLHIQINEFSINDQKDTRILNSNFKNLMNYVAKKF